MKNDNFAFFIELIYKNDSLILLMILSLSLSLSHYLLVAADHGEACPAELQADPPGQLGRAQDQVHRRRAGGPHGPPRLPELLRLGEGGEGEGGEDGG